MSPCAQIIRSGGVADGRGAAAQVGQRVGLAQGTASRAGQFKGLLVMRLCDVAGAPVGEGLLEWRDGPGPDRTLGVRLACVRLCGELPR